MMEHQEELDARAVSVVKDALPEITIRPVVRDEETGRVGELMFLGDWDDPDARPVRTYRLAFLRPLGGGVEWVTDPERVTVLPAYERARAQAGARAGRCAHHLVRQREGKTHCRDCGAQIYL